MFYWSFRLTGRVAWRVLTGHYFMGLENLPKTGGVILCSNHVSYLDPPVIAMGTFGRRLNFMARDSLFRNPVFRLFIRALNAFPVRRGGADRDAWREFQSRVDGGKVMVLFPEGTRSPDGNLGQANPGSGMLIHRCKNAVVLPVRVFGVQAMWPRGRGFQGFYPTAVTFGKPVDLAGELAARGGRETYQAIADKVMASISRLQPPPAFGRKADAAWPANAPEGSPAPQ